MWKRHKNVFFFFDRVWEMFTRILHAVGNLSFQNCNKSLFPEELDDDLSIRGASKCHWARWLQLSMMFSALQEAVSAFKCSTLKFHFTQTCFCLFCFSLGEEQIICEGFKCNPWRLFLCHRNLNSNKSIFFKFKDGNIFIVKWLRWGFKPQAVKWLNAKLSLEHYLDRFSEWKICEHYPAIFTERCKTKALWPYVYFMKAGVVNNQ